MRFRKLRVAWSVFWGVACVLLIVLWVRSYWWIDTLDASCRITSSRGLMWLVVSDSTRNHTSWGIATERMDDSTVNVERLMQKVTNFGFHFSHEASDYLLIAPI